MDLLAPSSIEGTLVLIPIGGALGWVYGFVGYVGYAKQVAHADPERSRAALTGVLVAVGLVVFFRHIVNGQLNDGLLWWLQETINNGNPLVMLFLILPLGLIVAAAGLAAIIGGFAGAAVGIWRTLYYLPGFFLGLPIVLNWLFVKHPAEPIVTPALRDGRELETKNLRDVLTPRASDLELARPLYHYEHQAQKARALAAKLNDDAHIAEAAVRRERARAALEDAERELREAQRRARGSRDER